MRECVEREGVCACVRPCVCVCVCVCVKNFDYSSANPQDLERKLPVSTGPQGRA